MILLKFEKQIKGEAKTQGHTDWINVDSFQFGVGRSITKTGAGAGRDTSNPNFSEISFNRMTDSASTELCLQAACGGSLGKCEIHFIQQGGVGNDPQVYLVYELADAIISSYSASSDGEKPTEVVGVNYTKIQTQHTHWDGEKATPGPKKGFDLIVNKAATF
jgi:type VI secretion system secreted protein Hcp